MSELKHRKYPRNFERSYPTFEKNDDTELTLTTTMAIGILSGIFLIGLIAGKLLAEK